MYIYIYQQRLKFPFSKRCSYQTFWTWNQRCLRSWVFLPIRYVNNMAGLRGKQTWKHEHVPPLLFLDPTCYGIVVNREVLLDCSCPWLTSDWIQKLPNNCPLVNSNFCRPWRQSLSQDLSSSVHISIAKGKYCIKNKPDMIRFIYRIISFISVSTSKVVFVPSGDPNPLKKEQVSKTLSLRMFV